MRGKGTSSGLREISIGAVSLSVLAGALLGCVARETPSATEPVRAALSSSSFVPAGFGCAWHDEFGGDQGLGQARADLDTTSWSFQELNVNGEQQVYTTKQCLGYPSNWNYCVEDGRLRVQGRNELVTCDTNGDGVSDNPVCAQNYGNGFHASASYTSGRLMSKHKVHFHDGYLEFRVKLPDAARAGLPESGMWPAVWMLGENIAQGPTPGSVDWPGCGEVDVMEYSTSGGASKQGWNAIWAGPGGTNACSSWPQGGNAACGPCDTTGGQCVGAVVNGTRYEMTGWPNFDNHSWHTYGFRWDNTGNNTTDQMTWFIDGVKMGVLHLGTEQAAFKNDMFLTINLALGGSLGGPIQITDWADAYIDVDYLRWYRSGQSDVCGLGATADAGTDASVDAGTDLGTGSAGADAAAGASGGSGGGAAGATGGAGGAPSPCAGQPDGTACDDGNACTSGDSCQAGACVGGTAVTCAAADACHVAGTCNPSTGVCSTPAAPNGTACDDGNACNGHETCQAGACTAGVAVTCAAVDACHVAGACNPATGACSTPAAPNGTACSDGSACTNGDSCQAGSCVGGTAVTCVAADACHVVGTCNPATGVCSTPAAANGTACSDGNACTNGDSCQAGACVGAAVTCVAADACHVAGTCNPSTGVCSTPAAANGTACNDGNACTSGDSCQAGACVSGAAVTCAAADACHVAGTCNPSTGVCSTPAAANGTACSDGNACTSGDSCQSGVCTGTPSCSSGTGLTGEYFDNADLTNLKITRVDATVNFNWGTGAPDPSIGPDTFSVRWSGTVTPLFTETYTFYVKTDDGVRLWVNNQQLVNRWVDQGATEVSGTIALTAGTAYAIKMEYYDNGGGALAQLSWSSARTAKQIIPQAQLTPATVAPPPPPPPVTFPLKINFQPTGVAVPSGYVADTGDVYGARTTSLTYGWSVSHTGNARKRGVNADARLDTLNQFHAGAKWEVAVPNGTYNVLVSIGDPSYASTFTINVEGVSYWKATSLAVNKFLHLTKSVTVTDGRLTIDQGTAAEMATRIDYVEISQ